MTTTTTLSLSPPAWADTCPLGGEEALVVGLLAPPRWVDLDAPFGVDRQEAVLDELGLVEARKGAYRALCAARDARVGTPAERSTDCAVGIGGADAGMRRIAIGRVLHALGGLRRAVVWVGIDHAGLSRDARRWLSSTEGSDLPPEPAAPPPREGLGRRQVSRRRWGWRRESVRWCADMVRQQVAQEPSRPRRAS